MCICYSNTVSPISFLHLGCSYYHPIPCQSLTRALQVTTLGHVTTAIALFKKSLQKIQAPDLKTQNGSYHTQWEWFSTSPWPGSSNRISPWTLAKHFTLDLLFSVLKLHGLFGSTFLLVLQESHRIYSEYSLPLAPLSNSSKTQHLYPNPPAFMSSLVR